MITLVLWALFWLWVGFLAAYHVRSSGTWILSLTGRTIMLSGVAQALLILGVAHVLPFLVGCVVSAAACISFWMALKNRDRVHG